MCGLALVALCSSPYEGYQVVGVRIAVSKCVKEAEVSLLNNISERKKIVSKKADLVFGWNEVRFDKPIELMANSSVKCTSPLLETVQSALCN